MGLCVHDLTNHVYCTQLSLLFPVIISMLPWASETCIVPTDYAFLHQTCCRKHREIAKRLSVMCNVEPI